uniref:PH domain-containing protein n=1 Tax=Seriola lalandi dorsalis TaxID=1841481 RepID=A0A3B4WPG6_SERLL
MEGMLYKWTNYISGWQPRWFVLDGGTLSYYDSQEDAWKGCKGSIKISVCEIQGWYCSFCTVYCVLIVHVSLSNFFYCLLNALLTSLSFCLLLYFSSFLRLYTS